MRKSALILPLLLLLPGCGFEPSYPHPFPASEPSPPLSVGDVIRLLHAGFSETAIFTKIRNDGIEARPTTTEILELREFGASDGFLAGLMAAALPDAGVPVEPPPQVSPAERSFPNLPIFPCWVWHEDPGRRLVRPRNLEP